MERNLVSPCDVSPIQPKQLREAENLKPGLDMEKLFLERVMLRKELKLRSMQEKLLDQTQKLEEAEEKLAKYESLPGFTQFLVVSKVASNIAQMGERVANRLQRGATGSGAGVYMVRLLNLKFYIAFFYSGYLLHHHQSALSFAPPPPLSTIIRKKPHQKPHHKPQTTPQPRSFLKFSSIYHSILTKVET